MATLQNPSLSIKRHYAVPVEKVFKAWTDPQALKRWWGPKAVGDQVSLAQLDVQLRMDTLPGGRKRERKCSD